MSPNETGWVKVLNSAARLQELIPDAVLVGGTAAAQHAGHRISLDGDHVLTDLRDRFDQLLEDLEATDGWITARVRRPVLILGSLDGVETGIRQLVRRRPLEVMEVVSPSGDTIRIPTLDEMIRVKAWLVLKRNATRDYLDVVALAERLGERTAPVLTQLDDYYQDQTGPSGMRIATQLARQLAEPRPYDLAEVELARYRKLAPRWHDWGSVAQACQRLAGRILEGMGEPGR